MQLTLPAQLIDDLLAQCRSEAPREAVGLLAAPRSDPHAVCAWAPAHNRSHTPENAFLVWPEEQFKLEMQFEQRGWVVAAAFHSHPTRDAQPSGMDCEFLSERRPMLIVSLAMPELRLDDSLSPSPLWGLPIRAWIARDGETEEVRLRIEALV